jgi:hypothetical protein
MRPWPRLSRCLAAAAVLGVLGACATMAGTGADRAFEVSAAWIGGRPAVAWYGGRLAREAIFLRFADSRGRPVAHAMQLSDASRDAFEPSLQQIGGDALVAWYEQDRAVPPGTRRQAAILGRFDSSGRQLWLRQLSSGDASGRNPVVRVAGAIIHAAWIEQRADAQPRVKVATLDAAGRLLQPPHDVAAAGSNTWNLNAAVDRDGALHVLFDAATASRAKELHWVRVRGDAIDDRRASRDDGIESAYPDIALDGTRYAVTWFDSRAGNSEVYLRCGQLDPSGALPANLLLDEDAALRVTHTPAESTGAYVAWQDERVVLAWIEGEGAHRVLWLQQFDPDCHPAGAARRVDGRGAEAGVPSLAASAAGLLLAWNGQRAVPAAANQGRGRKPASVVLLEVSPARQLSPNAAAR